VTKLIFACDVSDGLLGDTIITKVAPHIDFVKVGLEAMTANARYGGTLAQQFQERAKMYEKETMWDMKLHDVSNTMGNAARNIVQSGAQLFTLHATASDEALAAVAEAAGDKAIALAVTVLTDLDEPQCQSRFGCSPASAVVTFAKNAYSWGIKGFVCSGHEAPLIREALPKAYIVTPGIRPLYSVKADEQKRIMTPVQAKNAGADAIVVGRPIYDPPLGYTEHRAALEISQELASA
jgi:orotidine-5'-phosphate decarboxylase